LKPLIVIESSMQSARLLKIPVLPAAKNCRDGRHGASNHAFIRLAAGGEVNLTKSVVLRLNLSLTINQPGGNDFFCTDGLNITF